MPRAYSADLRERVLAAAHAGGASHLAVAARFAVGESTVRAWLRAERTAGRVAPKPWAGGPRSRIDGAVLRALVREGNDRTLAELAAAYGARTGVAVSPDSVWRACRRLDLRRKKKEPRPRRADA
jgi:transposase